MNEDSTRQDNNEKPWLTDITCVKASHNSILLLMISMQEPTKMIYISEPTPKSRPTAWSTRATALAPRSPKGSSRKPIGQPLTEHTEHTDGMNILAFTSDLQKPVWGGCGS